ncbi:hypothetical protein GGI11_007682, partial [Coemansia sp. RSA 2049]
MPQPRSLSRRQSIVLQSSFSHHLPLALPQRRMSNVLAPSSMAQHNARVPPRDRRMSQPPTAAPAAVGGGMSPKSIASTKSLPYPRERDDSDAGSGMLPPPLTSAVPQDRRRSVAYERYPPLVSMFEPHRTVSGESFACSPEFRRATTVSEVSSPSSFASGLRAHDMATASFSPHSSWLQQHQPSEARSPDQASVRAVSGHADWVHGDGFYRQSVPQQPQNQTQTQTQHQHQHQHQILRPFEPSGGSSRSSSSSNNSRHSPQTASLSLATNQIGSAGSGSIATITTRTSSSISNGGGYQRVGGNNSNNGGSTQSPPSLRRNPNSSTSLASASSSSSSSSSSLLSSISSAPSTYAYIFDSARSPLLPPQAAPEDDLLAQKLSTRFRSRSNTVSSDPFRTIAAAASADIARRKSAQNLLLAIADGSGFDSVMPATAVGHSAAAIPAYHEDVAEVRR